MMDNINELLTDLQHAITQKERHAILAIKAQNIRGELQRAIAIKEPTPQTLQDRLRDSPHALRLTREAADALDAHEATIAALVDAGHALARQAFYTMTGGHGHLIDDMCATIAKAVALK